MLPKWHILLGAIFTLVLYFLFDINLINLSLVFSASFLIDFDHYIIAVVRTKSLGLRKTFNYHIYLGRKILEEKKKGIFRKGEFFLFHTIEFHLLVLLLGFLWNGFFWIFIGMLFHSILDLIYQTKNDYLFARWFSIIEWMIKNPMHRA